MILTVCPTGTTGPSCTPTTGTGGSPGGSTGVPEPATLGLMGLGFLGAAWSRRRRTPCCAAEAKQEKAEASASRVKRRPL